MAMLGFFTVNCYSYTTKWDGLIRPNGVVVYCACDCISEHARYVGSILCLCNIFFCIPARYGPRMLNIVEVDSSLRAASPGTHHCVRSRRRASPARVAPSAAADSPAAHAFTCANLSTSVPAANPSPSAALALVFSCLCAASLVRAFALLFPAGLELAHLGPL